VAVFIFSALLGVYPSWGWLELPLLVLVIAAFATGVGLALGALFVRYRDIQPIWDVVSQMLFYASPVLYVSTLVPAQFQRPYHANPIAAVLCQMRHAVIDPGAPAVWEAIGGVPRLAIPVGVTLAALVIGLLVFRREAPRIAENL
jgi:ABC-2 type transport system permease protein